MAHAQIDLVAAIGGLDRVVVATIPVRYDGDFRAGAEVLDGIVNRADTVEELEDLGAIVPVTPEIIVPVGASLGDGLRKVARQHGDAVLHRIGLP